MFGGAGRSAYMLWHMSEISPNPGPQASYGQGRALAGLLPYLWPAGRSDLKLRIVVAVVFLVLAKLATVTVPSARSPSTVPSTVPSTPLKTTVPESRPSSSSKRKVADRPSKVASNAPSNGSLPQAAVITRSTTPAPRTTLRFMPTSLGSV